MKSNMSEPKLILASKSPRRRYLLRQAGLEFTVLPSQFDESSVPMQNPASYVKTLAYAKAMEIARKYPESWVIGADTVVVIDDAILGKPRCAEDARKMLERLSGKAHQVHTGYAVCCLAEDCRFCETITTAVYFKTLTPDEIEWYIQTGEPFDKAGAYAIQGIGTFLVKRIEGSYTNVVGLPVCELIEFLIKEGVVGRADRKLPVIQKGDGCRL